MASRIHVGIDLGTSNSAIALFDGDAVSVVGNASGETLTPSVVRIDARGGRTVGRRAQRALDGDPANTRAEWKRLMGTAERLRFEAAGAALLPEELSAQVIASLLADVRDAAGFLPRAAVISTPALFELPQNHATTRAGRLAGLEEVVLIQEPIASAIAAGWRADRDATTTAPGLAGLRSRGWDAGRLAAGDRRRAPARARPRGRQFPRRQGHGRRARRLGGGGARAAGRRRRGRAPRSGERARAADAGAPARGVRAGQDRAVARGPRVDRSSPMWTAATTAAAATTSWRSRATSWTPLTAPFIARSLAAVRNLLAKNQRTADDVARVVLVGGPTLMPALRAGIGDAVRRPDRRRRRSDDDRRARRGALRGQRRARRDAGRARAGARGRAGRAHRAPVGDRRPRAVRRRPLPALGCGPGAARRVRIEREDGGWAGARRAAVGRGQLRRPGAPRSQPPQSASACAPSIAPAARWRWRRARSRSCTGSRSAIRRWRARSASRARTTRRTSTSRRGRRCRRGGRSRTTRCGRSRRAATTTRWRCRSCRANRCAPTATG